MNLGNQWSKVLPSCREKAHGINKGDLKQRSCFARGFTVVMNRDQYQRA